MVLRGKVRPSRRVLIAAGSLTVASAALFVLIAEDLLDGGGLVSHDQGVMSWFVEHRSDRLIDIARFISAIGSFVSLAILGLLIGFWLWRRGWHLGLAASPLVSLMLGGLAASLAKALFDRPRPPASVRATSVAAAAFPSGHATDAAALFLAASFTLSITVTRRGSVQLGLVASGALCAALVGVSRLVLGVHWLSDVVAGWALGTAIAVSLVATSWWLTARSEPARPNDHPSPPRTSAR